MNKVKINLLALTAGVLISPALMAADVDTPSDQLFYSDEWLSTAVATTTAPSGSLSVTLAAEYTDDDVITWVIPGDAIEAGFGGTVQSNCIPSAGEPGDGLPGIAGLTFGILNQSANGAQYRVTVIDQSCDLDGVITTGATVEFSPSLTLDAQAVDAAGTITATYTAATETGTPLDTGGTLNTTNIVVTGSQFAAAVPTPFDAVVDVNADRLLFVGVGPPATTDDVGFWTVDAFVLPMGATLGAWATPVSQLLTVAGDFSWVNDSDSDPLNGIQWNGNTINFQFCTGAALTAAELTATCPFGSNGLAFLTAQNAAGGNDQVLPKTKFVSEHVLNFTGAGGIAGSITVQNIPLGEWTLNGFQADLSYTPYGPGIVQIIYLANRGLQAGDVTVDYVDQNGVENTLGTIGTLQPTSTLSIGPLINAALPSALRTFGRLALTITVNAPACDVQINAQYDAGGGRRAYTSARDNCVQDGGSY